MKKEEKHLKLESGAHREVKDGKGRYDLLPPKAIHRVALRLEFGAKKYGDRDWDKGLPKQNLIDSCLRHIFQGMNNQNNEDHFAAAVTHLLQLMEQEEN